MAVGQEELGEVARAHDALVPCGRTEVEGEVGEEKKRRRRREREEQQTDQYSPSILATTDYTTHYSVMCNSPGKKQKLLGHIFQSCYHTESTVAQNFC